MTQLHTPGPWPIATRIARDDSRLFAELSGGDSHAYITIEAADPDEELANARLIAAAPDLLEALTAAKNELHYHSATRNSEALQLARAAITKATGDGA